MKIRIKYDHRYILVNVRDEKCRKLECFYPHRWTTQSVNNNHTQVDNTYSCGTRNYHGCPIVEEE